MGLIRMSIGPSAMARDTVQKSKMIPYIFQTGILVTVLFQINSLTFSSDLNLSISYRS
jgi:hypothetical protein